MANVNIGGSNADASYRYKMPSIKTKVESSGNGIKTVVSNMVEIAKALHVPPDYPTRYFGIELGAQARWEEKAEKAVVTGHHTADSLSKLLAKFIEKFVLCPRCKLPEIIFDVNQKKGIIKVDCAACGCHSVLDQSHRLATYILKNPPTDKSKKEKDKSAKKKKHGNDEDGEQDDKKSEAASGHLAAQIQMDKKNYLVIEESKSTNSSATAAIANGSVQKNISTTPPSQPIVKEENKEEEWSAETLLAAKKARQEMEDFLKATSHGDVKKDLAARVEAIQLAAENKSGPESPAEVLRKFVQKEGGRPLQEIVAELRRLQLARKLETVAKYRVLAEALLDLSQTSTIANQATKQMAIFAACVDEPKLFLYVLEELAMKDVKIAARFPMFLKAFYDGEVLSEEIILEWADAPGEASILIKKDEALALKKKAEPFVQWLKNAEEESDDE